MKKIILACVMICGSVLGVQAQQIPLSSQYMFNELVINPAYAGSDENNVVTRLVSRNQWVGIDGAPTTQTVGAHALIKKFNIGVGGYVFNDQVGPTSQTGVQTAYAYHMPVGDFSKISFGLQLGLFQYKIDGSKLTTDVPGDVAVTKAGTESTIVPDASFGVLYYSDKTYVGATVQHIVPFKLFGADASVNRDRIGELNRHYFLQGGTKFELDPDWTLEPSVLVRLLYPTPVSVDINAKVYYQNTIWLGTSFRPGDSFVLLAGLKLKERFYFGYSYDITTSSLSDYTKGSHELMIGYNIDLGRKGRGRMGYF